MLDLNQLSRKLIDYTNVKGNYGKDAAVCAIIDDDLDILLEKRVMNENDPWSGQVSFPGGHFEKYDVYIMTVSYTHLTLPTSDLV